MRFTVSLTLWAVGLSVFFFFQAEDGIRDLVRSRGLGDVYKRQGLTIHDIDTIEINEAFASVVLAWMLELQPDPARVNPTGGAIALGHPLGATGAKLMTTMLHRLERTGGRYGLQTMCIGHGMATATIIERV